MKKLRWLFPCILLASACSKDDKKPSDPVVGVATGVYVLSEGTNNDSKLAFYDLNSKQVTGDFFLQQNPTITAGLGQYANDMLIYGSKLYIVVNASGTLVVADAANAKVIKTLELSKDHPGKLPRFVIPYKNKVYVSAWDNTVNAIDTSSLTLTKSIPVGPTPEGMAIVGSTLYVANSGGFNTEPDSTVSVVNLNTETETMKITIGTINPQKIAVNSLGDVYVSGYGVYGGVPPSVSVIQSSTNTVKKELGAAFPFSHVRIYKDVAFFYNNYGGTEVLLYNTTNNTVIRESFVTDGTAVEAVYGVNIDEENDNVYITDSKNFASSGAVFCFGSDGKKKFDFSTSPGVGPNTVVFKR
ncbi:MAG: hypothetical protein P0Y53_18895 [Candidatus Pseudobacter hemicellulosilyticus]|uniref:YncE family protein n=1 Tax=Candidatus Pseudobacter hemicellulosilyticus TaxID=3121375 RepID=A0AAJ5WR44_9BACT|nr:MAG: hypothetical protein P0Y53_18895 [Pseudobacter sp.]